MPRVNRKFGGSLRQGNTPPLPRTRLLPNLWLDPQSFSLLNKPRMLSKWPRLNKRTCLNLNLNSQWLKSSNNKSSTLSNSSSKWFNLNSQLFNNHRFSNNRAQWFSLSNQCNLKLNLSLNNRFNNNNNKLHSKDTLLTSHLFRGLSSNSRSIPRSHEV